MHNIEKVMMQANEVKSIYEDFLNSISEEQRLAFCSSFHLRPTSQGSSTIVSTLSVAPMRGRVKVSNKDLSSILTALNNALPEIINSSRDRAEAILEGFKFKKKKTVSSREEDAQAAFVRAVILNKFNGFTFVATEFDLFNFARAGKVKRPDVFVYRDGILYDIEFKNKRNGPKAGDIGYSPITQAEGYVAHIKEPENRNEYMKCISSFPNSAIGEINDICGIAVVPETSSGKSSGVLENAAKARNVELWTFKKDEHGNYTFNRVG